MQVERAGSKQAVRAYQAQEVRPAAKTAGEVAPATASAVDEVAFSQQSQQASRLRRRLQDVPEMRMELVERIKAQVEAGTYQVPPHAVAEKLLKSRVLE
jgi:flagellar biosynthesis anti-sigma factor FlgM